MEQWVSDTFYSYFPGYNNEYQKRQSLLQERQQEYQQNFLKHQLSNPPISKLAAQRKKHHNLNAKSFNTTTNLSSSSTTHSSDKTDIENNNNTITKTNSSKYCKPSTYYHSTTSAHRKLQDMRHTQLNEMSEKNVTEAEAMNLETARKSARQRDYQKELVAQIEEKRRSVELLHEKERQQEEALTRRLQEQLKIMQLEDQLEKEKLKANKVRFDAEQNRIMRDQLIAKLENDKKLQYPKLSNAAQAKIVTKKCKQEENKENHEKVAATNVVANTASTLTLQSDHNNGPTNTEHKVYKYFSNSANREYKRGKPLPEDLGLPIELNQQADLKDEMECFHLSDKICPMCDGPLKIFENCCLRCQRRLSLKLQTLKKNSKGGDDTAEDCTSPNAEGNNKYVQNEQRTFSLVCTNCERLYTLCPTCLVKRDVCRACHRKRSICMSCRRALCSFCLDEVACGKDTERSHINDRDTKHSESNSERSFQILEVNFAKDSADDDLQDSPAPYNNLLPYKHIHNDLHDETHTILPSAIRPSYSMNIERHSIFHPDYQSPHKEESPIVVLDNLHQIDEEEQSIECVRKQTENRLSRYFKNYGELAINRSKSEQRNRGTQTTPSTLGRRDTVLKGSPNLSMPLLREMPKMTRTESTRLLLQQNQRKIDNLKRRWEVPAVQKFIISPESPKVLTQVGAIRKQLQADLLSDDY